MFSLLYAPEGIPSLYTLGVQSTLAVPLILLGISILSSAIGAVIWFLGKRLIDQYDQGTKERDNRLESHEETIRSLKGDLKEAHRKLEDTVNGGYEELDARLENLDVKMDRLLRLLDAEETIDSDHFDVQKTDPMD